MNSQSNLERFSNLLEYFSASCSLRENCPNTENFLVRIFLFSVQIQENTDQKKLRIWTLFTQLFSFVVFWNSFRDHFNAYYKFARNRYIISMLQKQCWYKNRGNGKKWLKFRYSSLLSFRPGNFPLIFTLILPYYFFLTFFAFNYLLFHVIHLKGIINLFSCDRQKLYLILTFTKTSFLVSLNLSQHHIIWNTVLIVFSSCSWFSVQKHLSEQSFYPE